MHDRESLCGNIFDIYEVILCNEALESMHVKCGMKTDHIYVDCTEQLSVC
jgi:hypothetical protein